MDIVLSNTSDVPFYQQIASQIKAQIVDGTLAPGDELPSIRALANALHVSVITTKRAYADLAEMGFITQLTGKGSFVADISDNMVRENRIKNLEQEFAKLAKQGFALGLSSSELLYMLEMQLEPQEAGVRYDL